MSAESITDAIARHFAANVTGIKGAYASGAGGQGATVRTFPADIPDTPIALVEYRRFELAPGSFEKVQHHIDVGVYFNSSDAGEAYKTYLPFVSRVISSLRSNADLYGTCSLAAARSGGDVATEDVNGKPYIRLSFVIQALESGAHPYTVTP